MYPHQQRVIDELAELDEKIEKLSDFIGGAIYNELEETDRVLLAMQLSVMKAYSEILHKRINRF
ncbi:hypothetical protein KKJ17_07670 [Xenorhabdus bovienii]|uniref:crAss001_48 related protein n=1 Tax=Xenorhabdus bovienii TaxID=40576 RepID=UPI00237C8CE3|nr:hypothetical protein [Xenorhabdus bovienii]MDE1483413.1 hypothetical protein [Xenorhabdus bovienii]MDE9434022.1 hypothetical protein [Xenorhabdus bovienii]MDE9442494.1 hypothetical protein [Xenorhabdus bovienii]MDE9491648.1 hypothetical protein [Xenorhabdus bovienii]MDE9493337.1 hypothetical protein [Xenorhabdus bovienii]